MKRASNFKALSRAMAVIAAVTIVVSGVTYAALQSQQDKLTGNTIETSTANLLISTDGTHFSNTEPGFDFNNIIPGASAVPTTGAPFYLENTGGTPLGVKLAVSTIPANPNNIDLNQVNVIVTTVGSSGPLQTFTLQSLIDAYATGGLSIAGSNVGNNNSVEFKLQVGMNSSAVSGSSASLSNIDFALSGVASGS